MTSHFSTKQLWQGAHPSSWQLLTLYSSKVVRRGEVSREHTLQAGKKLAGSCTSQKGSEEGVGSEQTLIAGTKLTGR